MDDEIVAVAKLKLAHDTILEFRVDWDKNRLNPAGGEKKMNLFFRTYFQA